MVAPEHVDEQRSEDESFLSPVQEREIPPVSENIHAWRKPVRVLLGIVVSLIGGIVCTYFTLNPAGFYYGWIVAFFVGIAGAVLLRSRWAILVVPIAFTLGELLVGPQLFEASFMGLSSLILAFGGPILAVLGSLCSISIVKEAQGQGVTTMPTDF